jgi:tRNA (guanine26-N2/guanine27-N2)-dimethyltransferase
MFKKIKEGKVKFYAPVENKISKELQVFYNPLMEYNRTSTIAVLNAINIKKMQIALPLAGTGVRALRIMKELNRGIIKSMHINDYDKVAVDLIKKNLALNKIKSKCSFDCKDANLFFMESKGFDFIDIDPFGSPNKFLNSAIERLSRKGILAVTATDTGALCGTYHSACRRKYWAIPLHTEEMHEVGIRILIRKIQLIGVQFEKALTPILSFSKDHYMRIFLECKKSKKECDKIIKQHNLYKKSGPLWIGKLYDQEIIKKLQLDDKFTEIIKKEFDNVGFFDIPSICKKEHIKAGKKIDLIIQQIKNKGYNATRTQFSGQGVKTDISYDEFLKIIRK